MGKLRKWLTYILPILAMLFAFIGYALEGTDLYHAFLTSFKFVGTGSPFEPSNVFIEIARWCGIFFGASLLFAFLEAVLSRITSNVAIKRALSQKDPVAFHGDDAMAEHVATCCGKRAVFSDEPDSFKCNTQVLLYSDDTKALEFYTEHAKELAEVDRVIINLDSTRADSLRDTNIYPLNLADICAQRYWAQHPATENEKILLIGSGSYANSLITWGLLANVLSKESGITYSVIGNFDAYRMLHERVVEAAELCADKLVFLDGDWSKHTDLIREAGLAGEGGRVIVCLSPEESVHVASVIVDAGMCKRVHLRTTSSACSALFGDQAKARNPKEVIYFGTVEELCTPAVILEESQFRGGKICDLVYTCQGETCNACPYHPEFNPVSDDTDSEVHEAEGARRLKAIDVDRCLACETFNRHWRNWSGFVRQSNYAVAVHDNHKVELLKEYGIDVRGLSQQECVDAYSKLPEDARARLQEIEHLRWMRFHYLYNWRYAEKRDDTLRLHNCLVPYDELSDYDKVKDADAYKFLAMRVNADNPTDTDRPSKDNRSE